MLVLNTLTDNVTKIETFDNDIGRAFIDLSDVYIEYYRVLLEPTITDSFDYKVDLRRFNTFTNCDAEQRAYADTIGRTLDSSKRSEIFVYFKLLNASATGSVNLLGSDTLQECTWIEYNGTFPVIPDIILTTDSRGVQANIEYKTRTGFEMCVMSSELLALSVAFDWSASENQTVFCDVDTEIRCGSGECVKRNAPVLDDFSIGVFCSLYKSSLMSSSK